VRGTDSRYVNADTPIDTAVADSTIMRWATSFGKI
ncbi:hypothetical protein A2U01_0111230, partial [Trifolium medium]|nr:hypothetical protein [Trifolium medium]